MFWGEIRYVRISYVCMYISQVFPSPLPPLYEPLPYNYKCTYAGVHVARVALLAEKAEVQFNPDDISPEIIAEEINGLRFTAEYLPDASSGGYSTIDLKVHMYLRTYIHTYMYVHYMYYVYITCTVYMYMYV